METIIFNGNLVALIVRGKASHTHGPGVLEQHADVVLPDGSPMGFFGEDGGQGSSGLSVRSSSGSTSSGGSGGSSSNWGRSSASIGMGFQGTVYDYAALDLQRPYYIDAAKAEQYNVISTLLTIQVDAAQATAFTSFWQELDRKPKTFNILGGNCSVRASEGFRKAGILNGGIPGLDTPDHLYNQIYKALQAKVRSYSGYLGFVPKTSPAAGFDVSMNVLSRMP